MFAVIELQGHQYIVREGDEIVVDKLELESTEFVADKVLLIAEEDGSHVVVGKPTIAWTTVSFDVVTDFQKGEKTRILKFKRKNRYQRIIGFRPHQTVLKVTKIGKVEKIKHTKHAEETEEVDTEQEAPKKVAKKVKKAEEIAE